MMSATRYVAPAAVAVVIAALGTGCNGMDQKKTDPPAKAQHGQAVETAMPPLTADEARIIRDKGTEAPFTGKYWDFSGEGVYLCRQCGSPLYTSKTKFRSDCGWPSFDDEIPGAVIRKPDPDGRRTEIICAHCDGHLGHVFVGEGYTEKNTRHCVNSASLVFRTAEEMKQAADKAAADKAKAASATTKPATEVAIFAGGCFWGVEHFFDKVPGVIRATSGYTGGAMKNPTYEDVCTGRTGHAEAVQITYDPAVVPYHDLLGVFFSIHDPTTLNRQGGDVGTQYRSAIFHHDERQKAAAEAFIAELKREKVFDDPVVTEVVSLTRFYPAETYHQGYFRAHPEQGYCSAIISPKVSKFRRKYATRLKG